MALRIVLMSGTDEVAEISDIADEPRYGQDDYAILTIFTEAQRRANAVRENGGQP